MDDSEPQAKRRRVRGPNWTEEESHWLAVAKREEWELWKSKNPRGNMVPDNEKWEKIVLFLEGKDIRGRDIGACKTRWDYLVKYWRLIRDLQLKDTGNQDYWAMTIEERSTMKLPTFSKDIFEEMEFLCERACNHPKSTASSMETSSSRPQIRNTSVAMPQVGETYGPRREGQVLEQQSSSQQGDSSPMVDLQLPRVCQEAPLLPHGSPSVPLSGASEEAPLPPRGRPPVPAPERYTKTSTSPFQNSTGKAKKTSTSGDLVDAFKNVSANMLKFLEGEQQQKNEQFKEAFDLQQNTFQLEVQKAQNAVAMETISAKDRHAVATAFVELVGHFGKLTEKLSQNQGTTSGERGATSHNE